jgi:TolB-like protein/Tfp pilus assembly protein PilF
MTPERWQRMKELFHGALERSADERPAFLAEGCGDDVQARAALDRLLDAHAQAERFLETPAVGAATEIQPPPLTGQVIGHYEIRARLGVGGMGEVYEAYDRRLKRLVAIKLVGGGDARAQAGLWREAEHASGLNHPNICVIYEIGEAEKLAYIVMERVEGRPLSDVIPDSGFPTEAALGYALEISSALAHAHAHGIVHRDLKSVNVMVTPEGRMKVLDFGLARRLGDGALGTGPETSSWNLPGTIAGTLSYMAPEVLRGERADARSDVWALGVVLHEMLTGERPFAGQTPFELSSAILNGAPRPLPARAPASLLAVVRRCLEKDPAGRYPTAVELQAALEAARSGKQSIRDRMAATLPTRRGRSGRVPAVAITALLLLAAVTIVGLWRRAHATGAPVMLVVLPFDNLTGDKEQEYLSDGLTEELITQLGRLHPQGLGVIARTSAMTYKGTRKTVAEVAREMNVDYVLEGSVRRSGNTVRVSAQLIRAADQIDLWADTYERDLRDVLTVQTEVARAVADQIRLQLTPEQQARLASARPVEPEVHEAYLKGRFFWNQRTGRGLEEAIAYFQKALRADPNFASAYVGLADSYLLLGTHAGSRPLDIYPKAKAAALKALELDDTLAEAHTSLAYEKDLYEWDWAGAEREYRRAIELNPSYATAHGWLGLHFAYLGRMDEAIAEMRRARELDPLSLIINANLATLLHWGGREQEALDQFRKTLEMDPNFAFGRMVFGRYLIDRGMYKESIAELQTAVALSPTASRRSLLGWAYARSGNRVEALKILSELQEMSGREYVPPWAIANLYTGLGDRERAIEWLGRAYQERSTSEIFLKANPGFDPLRSDPRFKALLRQMNLPD